MNFPFIYKESQIEQVATEIIQTFQKKLEEKVVLVVGFTGDLGAGKTTLCKEILRQLEVNGLVVSPTFVLRKDYEGILDNQKLEIIHIDAYRLEKKEQIKQVLGEVLNKTLVLVEWAELADLQYDLHFVLKHISDREREISLA
jgi:tRNA threonylcarbamoyladenosine biosynthesis protein TsaE